MRMKDIQVDPGVHPLETLCEFIEQLPPNERQNVCRLIINTARATDPDENDKREESNNVDFVGAAFEWLRNPHEVYWYAKTTAMIGLLDYHFSQPNIMDDEWAAFFAERGTTEDMREYARNLPMEQRRFDKIAHQWLDLRAETLNHRYIHKHRFLRIHEQTLKDMNEESE